MSTKINKYSRRGIRSGYASTVVGISLVLFMIGLILGGVIGIQGLEKQVKEDVQVDLFFNNDLNEADIKMIEIELQQWKEFSEVYFVSPERAMQEFEGVGTSKEEMLEILDGENPLPPTVVFKPQADFANKKGLVLIEEKLTTNYPGAIAELSYNEASLEDVNVGFQQFVYLLLGVAVLLIVIAVAMINNTIRLALYAKRFTIKTMQLVGAKGSFIRRPFIVQAIIQGVLSAIFGLFLLVLVFYTSNNIFDTFEISFSRDSFVVLAGTMLTLGIFMTVMSTWFALNKYLRMSIDDLYS
ncbi:MAG: permease-like cell division protein FtsX [Crocinitomicaceae bacterium]|nr:permease-like cell division protein FtsX [Crocinitomicaceae bacterium]MDG1736081.1 permease-like cell division protein FtsX [Crocinitomicaceae bacterium]